MRNQWIAIALLGACLGMAACDDDSSSSGSEKVSNLCEGTGGTLDGDACVCGGEKCTDAKWCDSKGKCSTTQELTPDLLCTATGGTPQNGKCSCSGVECTDGVLCSLTSKKCAQNETNPGQQPLTADELCTASGGTPQNGKCKCDNVECASGTLCNIVTKKCAQSEIPEQQPLTPDELCTASGGTPQNGKCACNGTECTSGVLCDLNSKKCAQNSTEPGPQELTSDALCEASGGTAQNGKCTCSGEECIAGALCNFITKRCGQDTAAQVTFEDLCKYSGGTMDGDYCKCGDETCEKDKLCTSDGKCSKEAASVEYVFCTNDSEYHGQLQECNGSTCTTKPCLDDKTGDPVSCDGNACGKCLDYVSSCENNDEGNGVVYMCQGGKKQSLYTCADGVSCLKKDCAETGCAGETWCGECHEGEFVCKNGNVPKNTKLATYDGMMDVPEGTIVGMRSKCVEGKWTQLALDDPENCYFGSNGMKPGQQGYENYPKIDVNGKDIITVWNYNSSGQASTYYSLAACAEDGINCGGCAYSFSYCSNNKYYTCNNGKVLELTCEYADNNGNTGCYAGNSCYKHTTAGYCNATSCQNCKAICNW